MYGLLETDGSPAQLNDASATKAAASQIGASAYELKKSNAQAGAPKAQFKTTGENSVEVSMAASDPRRTLPPRLPLATAATPT